MEEAEAPVNEGSVEMIVGAGKGAGDGAMVGLSFTR